MVNAMQVSLKQVRQVLGLGVQELADRVGLTSSPFNLEKIGRASCRERV